MTEYQVASSLRERETEEATIAQLLDAAAGGAGAVALIEGEAGIGKSALLTRAAEAATERGFDVLRASGRELEGDFPFGVAAQLLARRLRAAADDERTELLRGAAGGAPAVLEGAAGTSATDALAHVNALSWLVTNLTEIFPVALVVDDAHLADPLSLRLLLFLAERADALPLALLVAARPASGTPAGQALAILRSRPATTVLRPQPLSERAVAAVLSDRGYAGAHAAFVSACAQASGGNPLLLRELLLVLAERAVPGTPDGAARVHDVGPRAVAEAVYLTLERVGPAGTALVRAIAVLGPGAPITVAAQLARIDPDEAVTIARQLADAGTLADGDELAFAHPILHSAVYEDLRAFERAYAHAQAARLLHAAGASTRVVASHLLESDPVGEAWAQAALRATASAAMAAGEPAAAARHLRRALDEPGAGADVALLGELAAAQSATGDAAATETLDRALAIATDPLTRARLQLQLGRVLLAGGAYGAAASVLRAGLEACPAEATQLALDLRAAWTGAALWDPDTSRQAYAETPALLPGAAAPVTTADRLALAGLAGLHTLRNDDRHEALRGARAAWDDGALLAELGPQDPTIYAITAALTATDQLDESLTVWEALLETARAQGLLLVAATAAYGRGNLQYMRGRLADALSDSLLALEARVHGWGMYACGAIWTLAQTYLAQGELELARAAVTLDPDEEAALARGVDVVGLEAARAEVALAQSDPARALEHARRAGAVMSAAGWEVHVFSWRHPGARAYAALGRTDEALAVAEEAVALARRWGVPGYLSEALRTLAAVDPARRLAALQEAIDLVVGSQRRLEVAQAHVALGLAQLEAGQDAQARVTLRTGLDAAEASGASALAARARAGLRAAGGRPRRARTTGAAALTPAELRVARLAATGSTNREIAEQLFVTVKAVKFHLGNAYRKLAISSRSELAAALRDG